MYPIVVIVGLLFIPFVAFIGVALGWAIGYAIYGEDYVYSPEELKKKWRNRWKEK